MPRAGGNQLRRTKWGPFTLEGCAAPASLPIKMMRRVTAAAALPYSVTFGSRRACHRSQGGTVLR
jgi:hypothetical protein